MSSDISCHDIELQQNHIVYDYDNIIFPKILFAMGLHYLVYVLSILVLSTINKRLTITIVFLSMCWLSVNIFATTD